MAFTIVSSSRFGDHITPPGHPESPERAAILDGVAERARGRGVGVLEPREATDEQLLRVHTPEHVGHVEATRGHALMLDPDTFTSPDTAGLARLAAGAALVALDGGGDALVLVRPPGHHAESDRVMGFCYYNNIAVAAAEARARGVERVAIVDFDVHHGNGTEQMFRSNPNVLFISTHQYPFYPGTGAASDVGIGEGAGFTVNIPLEGGATDGDYQHVFERVVLPVVAQFAPQLMLVSAGFDAHEDDPLAQMRTTTAGFAWIARCLRQAARDAGAPLVLVTEGGYALEALAGSLDAVARVLEGEEPLAPSEGWRAATDRSPRAVAAVRAAQSAQWRGL